MRTKSKLLATLIASVALVALFAAPAQAQLTPTRNVHALTNGTAINIAGAGQSNLVASIPVIVNLRQGSGFTVQANFAATNASTSQVGISLLPSYDGTTFATTPKIWVISALNGTTGVRPWTNYTRLDGVRAVKVVDITNGHASTLFVTNVVISTPN